MNNQNFILQKYISLLYFFYHFSKQLNYIYTFHTSPSRCIFQVMNGICL